MHRMGGKNIHGHQYKEKINLADKNFQNAQAGRSLLWKISLFTISIIIASLCSIFPVFSGLSFASIVTYPEPEKIYTIGVTYFIYIATLILITIFELNVRFSAFIVTLTLFGIIVNYFESGLNSIDYFILILFSIAFAYIGAIIIGICLTFSYMCAGLLGALIAIFGAGCTNVAITQIVVHTSYRPNKGEETVILITSILVIIIGVILTKQALNNSPKYAWMIEKAIFWASIGGTSFYGVDLTDACFDGADLRYTDLRNTKLTHTSFRNVTGLEFARLQGTILEDPKVRKLLVTGYGRGEDFTEANLNEANLRGADLREAVLVKAKALEADFSGAILTDACIQDWSISHNTRFQNVECRRIYLKCSEKGHFLEPKPDSGEFQPGEFDKWITEIRDTIDLIFRNGLNLRAFAFSLTQTAINHEGLDLSVRSIENKGDGVVVAKVGVSLETNKTAIHKELTEYYHQAFQAIEAKYQLVLTAKEDEIERLVIFNQDQQKFIQGLVAGIAETQEKVLIQGEGNRIYIIDQAGNVMESTNQNINAGRDVINNSKIEDSHMAGDRNINTGGGNYNERIERDYIQGNYYAAGQPQSLAEAAAEIQLLLKQLEQTYPTTTTSQQMVVAAEAINRIESNPTLKKRVINAVKEGGLAAFEKAIDNPAGAFIVGAIKGWQEVEAED
ncbi:pentapeptide repeat-containing protein (plasmid) [Nostoc sp. 'Peltigera membranacea cyanobiont' N6]|nr:pentapeptide repeat-containing protein [Nostoc sp. 'Peltigera membranacea cyanobiont' N6]